MLKSPLLPFSTQGLRSNKDLLVHLLLPEKVHISDLDYYCNLYRYRFCADHFINDLICDVSANILDFLLM